LVWFGFGAAEAQEMQQQQWRPHKDNIAGGFTLIRLTIDKRGDLFGKSESESELRKENKSKLKG